MHYDRLVGCTCKYVLFCRARSWCGRDQNRKLFVQICISRHSTLVEQFSVEYYLRFYLCSGTTSVVGASLLISATILNLPPSLWLLLKSRPAHSLILSSQLSFTEATRSYHRNFPSFIVDKRYYKGRLPMSYCTIPHWWCDPCMKCAGGTSISSPLHRCSSVGSVEYVVF